MKFQIPNSKFQKGVSQLPKKPLPPPFETLESKTPTAGFRPPLPPQPEAEAQKEKLEEMKKADEEKSKQLAAKIIQELEQEIAKWRKIREEQLKARRQPPEEQQFQEEGKKPKETLPPLQEPSTKPKRGLFGLPAGRQGFWGRRIKSAQQQNQPEMVGRRVGG